LSFSKDHAIIAQNSATAAATIYSAIGPQEWSKELYEQIRTDIFSGSIALAGAETIVQTFDAPASVADIAREAAPAGEKPFPQSNGGGFSASGGGTAGATVLKFGKHRGKTIAQVASEDPGWLDWASQNTNNDFVKTKIREFLSN
jgi:hypothetical protein